MNFRCRSLLTFGFEDIGTLADILEELSICDLEAVLWVITLPGCMKKMFVINKLSWNVNK